MVWDIFCKVIDNHGDLGVCWRLCAQLAARGERVRLWVDDVSALEWMAPQGCDQEQTSVEVVRWIADAECRAEPGDVVIEAFGCELSLRYEAAIVQRSPQPIWINLEYLTAQAYAARNHGLASPVLAGPASGATKYFFYPGFTVETGGLLRERGLAEKQQNFDADAWLRSRGVERNDAIVTSLFCYEPHALPDLIVQLASAHRQARLLVTSGRPADATRAAIKALDAQMPGWNSAGRLQVTWLPLMAQPDFDHLLWTCDLNFVRGEDSLVRALLAGRPFIWHIYPQHDDAHHDKLHAFLDWLDAPTSLRDFHLAWNGMTQTLPAIDLASWRACALDARLRLLNQEDLVTRLMHFIDSRRAIA